MPQAWKEKRVLLHFGAVDWKTDVWVNDVKVGSHTGGFTPFSFDITAAMNRKGDNKLVVKVWDPTDDGYQPRGKQVNRPEGIWYTCGHRNMADSVAGTRGRVIISPICVLHPILTGISYL